MDDASSSAVEAPDYSSTTKPRMTGKAPQSLSVLQEGVPGRTTTDTSLDQTTPGETTRAPRRNAALRPNDVDSGTSTRHLMNRLVSKTVWTVLALVSLSAHHTIHRTCYGGIGLVCVSLPLGIRYLWRRRTRIVVLRMRLAVLVGLNIWILFILWARLEATLALGGPSPFDGSRGGRLRNLLPRRFRTKFAFSKRKRVATQMSEGSRGAETDLVGAVPPGLDDGFGAISIVGTNSFIPFNYTKAKNSVRPGSCILLSKGTYEGEVVKIIQYPTNISVRVVVEATGKAATIRRSSLVSAKVVDCDLSAERLRQRESTTEVHDDCSSGTSGPDRCLVDNKKNESSYDEGQTDLTNLTDKEKLEVVGTVLGIVENAHAIWTWAHPHLDQLVHALAAFFAVGFLALLPY